MLRFGSAHIKLLRAVADAGSANWHTLQKCIRDHGGATPGQKTAFVERLEELAVQRAESRAGALHALEEHQRKAIEASELEEQYREGLSIEMARLERYNPDHRNRSSTSIGFRLTWKQALASGRPEECSGPERGRPSIERQCKLPKEFEALGWRAPFKMYPQKPMQKSWT